LDPQSAIALRDFTKKLCDEGVTVIWTTHNMQEPEKICDRVGIIYEGRMIQIGNSHELSRSVSEMSVIEIDTPNLSTELIDHIRKTGEACKVVYEDPVLRITCMRREEVVEEITRFLVSSGAKIRAINTKEPTLEEAFISLTGGEEEIDRFLEMSRSK